MSQCSRFLDGHCEWHARVPQPHSSQDARALPRKGDHAGYAQFYREYEGAVLAYMRQRVRSSDLAADLTMEVFAAALLAIHVRSSRPRTR